MKRMKQAIVTIVGVSLWVSTAQAYEPVTHAGLTDRAARASTLHKRLVERLGLSLGLYEPLTLERGAKADRELQRRLTRLDPEGGYAPDDGRQSALAWLTAGSVVEGVPADRLRHHFFDPSTGAGLDDPGTSSRLGTRMAGVVSGVGTLRGVFTGASFDGTGMPSTAWLLARENDWGLVRFLDERERAASARTPGERENALVRALLAAGAILRVVETAGDPAYVRNDYRVALESEGAPYARFVAAHYGRLGLPAGPENAPAIQRPHLVELLHDPSGGGLADRTHRRFFSPGTLPSSRRYPSPAATPDDKPSGYVAGDAVTHLAAYRRTPGGVEWLLDDTVHRDYAEALLPETARYATAAIDLLFRGRLELADRAGELTATIRELGLGPVEASVYADTASGERKRIFNRKIERAAEGEVVAAVARPAWATRITAVVRGVDANGEPLVVVQQQ
jgi:hypothetical protein